ncbi:endonuclease domain-containing protein [Dyadobacter sp. CY326]|uniref:endonuclease domain-containing protein n=1 Tax=Dyadobacter sp. CY326 TaxID=2907300 RepID=UPI001F21E873|nr:endonuclease domain-containing protein [Dyadobacter sp. CY326]MCE7068036.1 endonuclease domain-containing protein [Dyadobacter sp. CY326]
MMHEGAKPILFARALELRKRETLAEKHLWSHLSNKKLGVKFRRQHPFLYFILDFYCHELKLAIEIDGGIHLIKENREYDEMRTELIEEFNIKVIRFTNEEVLFETEQVLEKIRAIIGRPG